MSFLQGIDFRATATYVTDPANCDHETGTGVTYPRTTPQGHTVGWEQAIAGTRDRSTTVDARLAGIAFVNNNTTKNYRIDLPAAGWYAITLAIGDATSAQTAAAVQVLDGTTVISNVVMGPNCVLGEFYDACGVEYTAANWPTEQVSIVGHFSSGILRIKLGRGSGSGATPIAHVFVQDTTAPTPSLPAGIDFRASSDYVSDPSGDSPALNGQSGGTPAPTITYPHITQQGLTVGWEQAPDGVRDRDNTVDPRLAGIHYVNNTGSPKNYRIDLPAAGTYEIVAAFGDATTPSEITAELFDNTTSLGVLLSGVSPLGGQYYDASGVLRTSAADWVANQAKITKTFSSTILRIKLGDSSASHQSSIAHLHIASPSSGTTISLGTSGILELASDGAAIPVYPGSGALVLASDSVGNYLIVTGQGLLAIQADDPLMSGPATPDSGVISLNGDAPGMAGPVQSANAGVLRLLADAATLWASISPLVGKLLLRGDEPTVIPVTVPAGKLALGSDRPTLSLIPSSSGRLSLKADGPTIFPVSPGSGKLILAGGAGLTSSMGIVLEASGILRLRSDAPVVTPLTEPPPPPPPPLAGQGIALKAVI